MKSAIEQGTEIGKQEIKKSAKDWYEYIQEHPMQSMFFGITIFYAIKGLLTDLSKD